MTQAPPKPRRWLLAVDPRVYHWDTLFVKGKEMWRHAGNRPDALRQLKQVHKGDRTLCYHGKPEHSLYALAEVTRDPYPDPAGPGFQEDGDGLARHRASAAAGEAGGNARRQAAAKIKFLKNTRLTICPLTDEEYSEILRMAGIVASPGIPLP